MTRRIHLTQGHALGKHTKLTTSDLRQIKQAAGCWTRLKGKIAVLTWLFLTCMKAWVIVRVLETHPRGTRNWKTIRQSSTTLHMSLSSERLQITKKIIMSAEIAHSAATVVPVAAKLKQFKSKSKMSTKTTSFLKCLKWRTSNSARARTCWWLLSAASLITSQRRTLKGRRWSRTSFCSRLSQAERTEKWFWLEKRRQMTFLQLKCSTRRSWSRKMYKI